jgi:hypothetical protein
MIDRGILYEKNIRNSHDSIDKLLLLIGIISLLIGGLIYLINRPAEHTYSFLSILHLN